MANEKSALKPTPKTYNLLYAKSGNRCAFPKCPTPITINKTLVADVAHIRAENLGGARYDASQTDDERRDYANLILLCKVHHKVVDDDEESYPVARLQKMKADHEEATTPLSADAIADGLAVLIDGDINVNAGSIHDSVIAGVYQVNNYAYGATPVNASPPPYKPSISEPPLFRNAGEKIGTLQPNHPFGRRTEPMDIYFDDEPYLWFRVLPTTMPTKPLRLSALEKQVEHNMQALRLVLHDANDLVIADDGIARILSQADRTIAASTSFLFRRGEIWSVETLCFSATGSTGRFYYSLIEEALRVRLKEFYELLRRLGVNPPLPMDRWHRRGVWLGDDLHSP